MAANPTTLVPGIPTLRSVARHRVLAIGVDARIFDALDVPGFDVVLAAPGRELAVALGAWTQDLERFDVVLCNVRGHDASGVHAYRAVARARPDLAARFVFVVDDGLSARRHFLLGEIDNHTVEASIDARALRALVRAI